MLLDSVGQWGAARRSASAWVGNILLHMAKLQPERIEAMVCGQRNHVLSGAGARESWLRFRGQTNQPACGMGGDAQAPSSRRRTDSCLVGVERVRSKDSYDDMKFTPADLSAIRARTLIVHGDRDPLISRRRCAGARCIARSRQFGVDGFVPNRRLTGRSSLRRRFSDHV